ncbi:MAG: hypothetical protein FWH55_01370 [Oscillospiraceae bacterium]|nr:hypothetical protein [Oscillospiraceae bacterium]
MPTPKSVPTLTPMLIQTYMPTPKLEPTLTLAQAPMPMLTLVLTKMPTPTYAQTYMPTSKLAPMPMPTRHVSNTNSFLWRGMDRYYEIPYFWRDHAEVKAARG